MKRKIIISLFFRVLLDFFYPISVKYFSYMWKTSLSFDIKRIIISYVLFLLLSVIIFSKIKTTSRFILEMLYIFIYIPLLTQYTYNNEPFGYLIIVSFFFGIVSFILNLKEKIMKVSGISRIRKRFRLKLSVENSLIILTLICIFILTVKDNRINWMNAFNLNNTYSIRENNKINGFLQYLVPVQSVLLVPYIVLKNIGKNKIIILVAIAFQLLLFMMLPHKLYLMIVVLVLVMSKTEEKIEKLLIINCLVTFLGVLTQNVIVSALVDRVFLLPAMLNFQYYKFFLQNPYNYFSGSKLSFLFSNHNNGVELSHRIANSLYNGTMNPNTGFIASAFGEWGIKGVVLIALLFILTLIYIDFISEENNNRMKSLCFFPFLQLINGQLVTMYLSTGLIFLMIYFTFLKAEGN